MELGMTVTTVDRGTATSNSGVGIMIFITDMRRTGIRGRMTIISAAMPDLAILASIIRTPILRGIAMFPATDTTMATVTVIRITTAMDIMARAALRPTGRSEERRVGKECRSRWW